MNRITTTEFKWSSSITTSLVESLIKSENDIKKVVRIFDAATAEYPNGYRHNDTTFGLAISRLVSANQFGSAEALLDRMSQEKCKMNEDVFLSLCRGYGRVHRPMEALRVFRRMEGLQCKPTSKSYVTILSILVDQNLVEDAFGFYKYMKQNKILLIIATLNLLIKALCKNVKTLDAAFNMFTQMPDHGFSPDSFTYGTLISGLCRFSRIEDAEKLFREMEDKNCTPTVITYSCLINGLCQHHNLDKALKYFAEMERKGITPNVFTYTSIIDGFGKIGRSSDALELFNRMIIEKCIPNAVTYTSLISWLCQDKKVQESIELLDRMKIQGLRAEAIIYMKIVTGLCELYKFREAANFVDEMVLEGIKPNRQTWSIHVGIHNKVIQGLCIRTTDAERGFQMYRSARSKAIKIADETFKKLVKCHCKKGDLQKIGRIVDEMVVDGYVPDHETWKWVVSTFGNRREASESSHPLAAQLMILHHS